VEKEGSFLKKMPGFKTVGPRTNVKKGASKKKRSAKGERGRAERLFKRGKASKKSEVEMGCLGGEGRPISKDTEPQGRQGLEHAVCQKRKNFWEFDLNLEWSRRDQEGPSNGKSGGGSQSPMTALHPRIKGKGHL